MTRVTLKGGAYTARSVIAACQRQVNLYGEGNPEESPAPTTLYPTPGLRVLATPPTGAGRGLYTASNNQLYAVVGSTFYSVSSTWVYTALGSVAPNITTPVSMKDNGTTLLCVDGTDAGYTVTLLTNAFATISSAAFFGGDRVDFVDTFFVLNKPRTGIFYASLANSTAFDPLYFATKIGAPDLLASIAVVHREITLIGQRTCEVWVNSGAAAFPFEILTGAFVEHGCAAKYSVATMGDSLFFLGQDKEGRGVVLSMAGYAAKRISTHAIENAIQGYSTIIDAVGYCYQQGGHQFYVLNFPTADKTWCYDIITSEWHERVWIDTQGAEHRHRANCHAFAHNTNVVADWQTGQLYALDLAIYTDNGVPIVRRRGFPHMVNDGRRVFYLSFTADMETGTAAGTAWQGLPSYILAPDGRTDTGLAPDVLPVFFGTDGGSIPAPDPQLFLRWSDNHGQSWSNPIPNGFGAAGDYLASMQFQRLGFARDRVFELFWSSPVRTALSGAFVEIKKSAS